MRQARASINRLGQLAAITGRSKGIERFDTLVSSAWWTVQKYGETQVWAANRLIRLNADDKRIKREKYAPSIEALGCDADQVAGGRPHRVGQVRRPVVALFGDSISSVDLPHTLSEVAIPVDTSVSRSNVVPIIRELLGQSPQPRHHLLPVMTHHRHPRRATSTPRATRSRNASRPSQ